jgi:hypothetical protein
LHFHAWLSAAHSDFLSSEAQIIDSETGGCQVHVSRDLYFSPSVGMISFRGRHGRCARCRVCMKTSSASTKLDPSDICSLRIAGFGACMITGYPHEGAGMFEVACGLVENRLSRPVQSAIVSLGGFPAPRAANHLKSKVFDFNPNYVVLQFGPTDAQCPIRTRNRTTAASSGRSTDRGLKSSSDDPGVSYHSQPATPLSPLRWELISLIGYLRKIDPITPLSSYIGRLPIGGDHPRRAVSVCLRITIHNEERDLLHKCLA